MSRTSKFEKAKNLQIGDLLVQKNLLSRTDVTRALQAQSEIGGLFGQVLIQLGLVSEIKLLETLSEQLGLPLLSADDFPSDPVVIDNLSMSFLASNNVVPVLMNDNQIRFAAKVPQDPYIHKAITLATGKAVELCLAEEKLIQKALDAYTHFDDSGEGEMSFSENFAGDDEFVEHLKDLASEAPVIRIVHQLFHHAIDIGASDIHIEPFDQALKIRFRVDGVMQEMASPPNPSMAAAITSRIKLLASLNIAERRLPQDGRIMMRIKGHELDMRVSTIPTVHGESVVLRVLDRQSVRLKLTDMGFAQDQLDVFEGLLKRPHGIMLVTGPTGSGKTTTLYAALSSMNNAVRKVITVEDPVEYQLSGINQIQVHPQIDLSFAKALRSILRQDPDVIMIGEMRDGETAQIAVQSALTGHLVLSTLHTNTAAGAITRLHDMGVERYLITSSVNAILSQRLVRKLCVDCREPVSLPSELVVRKDCQNKPDSIYRSVGCDHCHHTGYKGRTAVHELLVMTDSLKQAILEGADSNRLHQLACEEGMRTLYEDGLLKVLCGETSLEELLSVSHDQ